MEKKLRAQWYGREGHKKVCSTPGLGRAARGASHAGCGGARDWWAPRRIDKGGGGVCAPLHGSAVAQRRIGKEVRAASGGERRGLCTRCMECTQMHFSVAVYIYMYIYICIYICMYIYMYVYIYIYMYVCVHVCMYVCMHACMYACMLYVVIWLASYQ
jgi:hypothetical protein